MSLLLILLILWEGEEAPEDTDVAEIGRKRKTRRKDDPPQQQQEDGDQSPPQQPADEPGTETSRANSTAHVGLMSTGPGQKAATTGADRLTLAAPTAATSIAAVGTARPLTALFEAAGDHGPVLEPSNAARGRPGGAVPDPATAPEGADRLTTAVPRASPSGAALGTARPLTAPEGADAGTSTAPGSSTAAQTAAATTTADRLTLTAPAAATSVAAVGTVRPLTAIVGATAAPAAVPKAADPGPGQSAVLKAEMDQDQDQDESVVDVVDVGASTSQEPDNNFPDSNNTQHHYYYPATDIRTREGYVAPDRTRTRPRTARGATRPRATGTTTFSSPTTCLWEPGLVNRHNRLNQTTRRINDKRNIVV